MQQIKDKIRQVSQSLPLEATATNIMRHILKVIREEFDSEKKAEGQSLHQIVTADQSDELDYSESHGNLRNRLLDHLTEYKVELETSTENIAAQALEHIHTNEIILTVGISNTVEKFLKHAAKQRKFQVIVVEAAPLYRVRITTDTWRVGCCLNLLILVSLCLLNSLKSSKNNIIFCICSIETLVEISIFDYKLMSISNSIMFLIVINNSHFYFLFLSF